MRRTPQSLAAPPSITIEIKKIISHPRCTLHSGSMVWLSFGGVPDKDLKKHATTTKTKGTWGPACVGRLHRSTKDREGKGTTEDGGRRGAGKERRERQSLHLDVDVDVWLSSNNSTRVTEIQCRHVAIRTGTSAQILTCTDPRLSSGDATPKKTSTSERARRWSRFGPDLDVRPDGLADVRYEADRLALELRGRRQLFRVPPVRFRRLALKKGPPDRQKPADEEENASEAQCQRLRTRPQRPASLPSRRAREKAGDVGGRSGGEARGEGTWKPLEAASPQGVHTVPASAYPSAHTPHT
eukprot:1397456-Rhodomonas_salina.3